jgi:putative endonuclease
MIGRVFDRLRDVARRRRLTPDLAFGRRGEDLAHRFLRKQGFIIVARNYRLAAGDAEADLIAWEGRTLAIVEVKTRASGAFGPPERAVGPEKQRHLLRVAREYARKTGVPWQQVRFDVVTVLLEVPATVRLIRSAFTGT